MNEVFWLYNIIGNVPEDIYTPVLNLQNAMKTQWFTNGKVVGYPFDIKYNFSYYYDCDF